MNLTQRWTPMYLAAAAAALFSVSCGDRSTSPNQRAVPNDASRVISDGAHGGNSDVFFLPPLSNPNGSAGLGDPFQSGLPVVFKIVDLSASGQLIKELPATGSSADQQYQANWDTKTPALNTAHTYRIEVWIGARRPAYADVDVVSNGSQLKNVITNEYIGLQDGRTLPLKVRVEKGWACNNKASCVAEVVPALIAAGQKFVVKTNDQLNSVSFEGQWHAGDYPVIVAIENITSAPGANGCSQSLTTMLSKESCIKFTTDPPIVLTTPATITTCLQNPGDPRQMVIKYDVGETPRYLEDVPVVCPEFGSSIDPSASRAMRLASAAMNKVSKAFRWATGTKTAYAIDLGVGGRLEVGDDFSYFGLGLPSFFEAVVGQSQTGVVNNVLAIDPTVRAVALHHHGTDPLYVNNLTVTCTIVGASGSLVVGASLVPAATATDNGNGTYTCPPWKMPGTPASNTLRISSNKHDAVFLFPGVGGYSSMSGTFDFTATSVPDVVPTPALVYYSSEQYSTTVGPTTYDWDRYSFHVTNKASFAPSLFAPIVGAPSCVSHTLVNFYDAATNNYIYGFCGLSSPTQLDDIWFAVPRWTQPPAGVYIKLIDQVSNTVIATSNVVNLYGPLFRNFPRTLDLSWAPIPTAATYTVTVEYCSTWNPAGDWRVCTGPWFPLSTSTVAAPTAHVSRTFVGDQPGRWQVLSVDTFGNALPATPYKYFNFITPP